MALWVVKEGDLTMPTLKNTTVDKPPSTARSLICKYPLAGGRKRELEQLEYCIEN